MQEKIQKKFFLVTQLVSNQDIYIKRQEFYFLFSLMLSYQTLIQHILVHGQRKNNRTGIDTKTVAGYMFEHDMSTGFPLLTTKKVPFRLIASELEFFIKGITDKQRLIERKNHIRDERCSPEVIPYSHDPEMQAAMKVEREL
jgi:thymidylate synthase